MYSIIELQTTEGQTIHNFNTAETIAKAMSQYHTILSYAAISEVEYHSCIVVDEEGKYIARECYKHPKTASEEVADESITEEANS